jgi:hypothetical protein
MLDNSIFFQMKANDAFALNQPEKRVKIVHKCKHSNMLNKLMLGLAYNFHGDFIIQINIIVFLLNDIGEMERMQEDSFDSIDDSFGNSFNLMHFKLVILIIGQFNSE